jgi:hypothetical protein
MYTSSTVNGPGINSGEVLAVEKYRGSNASCLAYHVVSILCSVEIEI